MKTTVEELSQTEIERYKSFVSSCSSSLIYHTPEYLGAVAEIAPLSEPLILAASQDGRIVATLATFAQKDCCGTVLNSLPYFGSHGDILLANSDIDQMAASSAIAMRLHEICRERSINAVNIVSHPLAPQIERFADLLGLNAWDFRIGQITLLPEAPNHEAAMDGILRACHPKTRNLIRKGLRRGFDVAISKSDTDWEAMIEHHRVGMKRIGGRAKTPREFAALRSALEYYGGCRLYTGRRSGAFAGALLNLYHGEWVEYFTPVAVEEFRSEQVLSALIAHAMSDAILAGKRYWNWGGTWDTQAGVHHFKQGWGAVDRVYNFWGRADARLASIAPLELLQRYPYFYVRPFAK